MDNSALRHCSAAAQSCCRAHRMWNIIFLYARCNAMSPRMVDERIIIVKS
jgi:hypothetical protein